MLAHDFRPHAVSDLSFQQGFIADAVRFFDVADGSELPMAHRLAALRNLVRYARFHFAYAEKYLIGTGFAGIDAWVAQHETLFQHVDACLSDIVEGRGDAAHLTQWILNALSAHLLDLPAQTEQTLC